MTESRSDTTFTIRDLHQAEASALGELMVSVYSALEDFPSPEEQPRYYAKLAAIGEFAELEGARVLVATNKDKLAGGVVYFGDMSVYGSGGTAPEIRDASGIRLLAVNPEFRGQGVGRHLTDFCIELARAAGHREVILHTTKAMLPAWRMYESMGFSRSEDLDFMQDDLHVHGFRLRLDQAS